MAIGDSNDILGRLKAVLPPWFGSPTPILDALLSGPSATFAEVYTQIQYLIQQTRISTATEGWLDLISQDFFARGFNRRVAEQDGQYRARILKEILRPRVTRAAVSNALTDLTGTAPIIFEPARIADTGALGILAPPTFALGGPGLPMTGITADSNTITADSTVVTADASGTPFAGIGGLGSLNYPDQFFITAFRPPGVGIPNVAGLTSVANPTGGGGLGSGSLELCSLVQTAGPITDAESYATIARNIAAGITAWTRITAFSGSTPANFEWFPSVPDQGPIDTLANIAVIPSFVGPFENV